jgi:hypothetical protein
MKATYILILFFFSYCNAHSQGRKPDHISVAFTTSHTAFPFASFGRLFTKEFHPGVELGTGFNWKTKSKHDWFQSFNFGYAYHRFVQHSIALYSEGGYRYKFLQTFAAEGRLGAGYLHAIPVGKIYKLSADGNYKKTANWGRPEAMVGFSLRVSKQLAPSGTGAFLQYQQRIQLPFIKSYVPLLPSNILFAGMKFPLKSGRAHH